MRQRGQDRQRRNPGRLWRSPFGKRRGRRHSNNEQLPPGENNAPSNDQRVEKIPALLTGRPGDTITEEGADRTAKKPL